MKRNIYSLLFTILSITLLIQLSACEQDKCKTRGVKCQNGGTCFDGTCNCPSGYEGDSCQTLTTQKFNANFGGLITYPNRAPYPYRNSDSIEVSQVAGNTFAIQYRSVHDTLVIINGKVSNNNILFDGALTSYDGYNYKGTGSLNGQVITLTMKKESYFSGILQSSEDFTFVGTKY